jgi:hypothetical protein
VFRGGLTILIEFSSENWRYLRLNELWSFAWELSRIAAMFFHSLSDP